MGIAEEIYNELKSRMPEDDNSCFDWVPIDPEQLKCIYDQKPREASCDIVFGCTAVYAEVHDGAVDVVVVSCKGACI